MKSPRQIANVAIELFAGHKGVDWFKVETWLSRNISDSAPSIVFEPGIGSTAVRAFWVRVKPTADQSQAEKQARELVEKALTATNQKLDWSKVTLIPSWRSAGE